MQILRKKTLKNDPIPLPNLSYMEYST
jgi:hypothetical protein